MACLVEIAFHFVPATSVRRKRSFFNSNGSPPLWTISTRTGKSPTSCRFDSNNSWLSSSVSSGAARKEIEPRLREATVAGIGWSAAGGFTLKRGPLHEVTNITETNNTDLIARLKRLRKPLRPTFRSGLRLTIARILHVPRFVCQLFNGRIRAPRTNAHYALGICPCC